MQEQKLAEPLKGGLREARRPGRESDLATEDGRCEEGPLPDSSDCKVRTEKTILDMTVKRLLETFPRAISVEGWGEVRSHLNEYI